jgi:LDH2 family malate/lactate/ureidoglycolate dehydrogenase
MARRTHARSGVVELAGILSGEREKRRSEGIPIDDAVYEKLVKMGAASR